LAWKITARACNKSRCAGGFEAGQAVEVCWSTSTSLKSQT